jgi:hypothetical protein
MCTSMGRARRAMPDFVSCRPWSSVSGPKLSKLSCHWNCWRNPCPMTTAAGPAMASYKQGWLQTALGCDFVDPAMLSRHCRHTFPPPPPQHAKGHKNKPHPPPSWLFFPFLPPPQSHNQKGRKVVWTVTVLSIVPPGPRQSFLC